MPIPAGGEEVNQLERKSCQSDTGRDTASPTPKGLVICLRECSDLGWGMKPRREREGEAAGAGWHHLL